MYNGYTQIAEMDATNEDAPQVVKTYLWDPSEPVATRILHMNVWNNGVEVESLYYTHDLPKNVTALFGQAAGRRAQYEHDPYGNLINTTGDAAGLNPYRYSSEYLDEDLGLIYYNYRHYNPTDGRWINRDPIPLLIEKNLYVYIDNKNISFDVLGLITQKDCEEYISKFRLTDEYKALSRNLALRQIMYNLMFPHNIAKSCTVKIDCDCACKAHGDTVRNMTFTVVNWDNGIQGRNDNYQIRLNPDAHKTLNGLKGTLMHELVHFFDGCISDHETAGVRCLNIYLSEIRANLFTNCSDSITPSKKRACVKKYVDNMYRVLSSVPDCKDKIQAINDRFDELYNYIESLNDNPYIDPSK